MACMDLLVSATIVGDLLLLLLNTYPFTTKMFWTKGGRGAQIETVGRDGVMVKFVGHLAFKVQC